MSGAPLLHNTFESTVDPVFAGRSDAESGTSDERGVEDVLNLDGTGPELLQQDYAGNIMDDPGYYITTVYQQRGVYWYRSDGVHGTHSFPAYEKWSVMWHGRPAVLVDHPPPGLQVRDWGNDPRNGVSTAMLRLGKMGGLYVTPVSGCKYVTVGAPVADGPSGREIALRGFSPLFERPAKAHATVTLAGLYHWTDSECDASVAWTESSSPRPRGFDRLR